MPGIIWEFFGAARIREYTRKAHADIFPRQCPIEAARARGLLTAREASQRARRKLDFLRMAEVTLPFGD